MVLAAGIAASALFLGSSGASAQVASSQLDTAAVRAGEEVNLSSGSGSQLVPWIWPTATGAVSQGTQLVPWIWPTATGADSQDAQLVPWIWPNSSRLSKISNA